MRLPYRIATVLAVFCLTLASASRGWTDDNDGWVELTGLDAWKSPTENWLAVGSAGLDAKNPKMLAVESGTGVIYNGPTGKGRT